MCLYTMPWRCKGDVDESTLTSLNLALDGGGSSAKYIALPQETAWICWEWEKSVLILSKIQLFHLHLHPYKSYSISDSN
jgi:hypothetical protein